MRRGATVNAGEVVISDVPDDDPSEQASAQDVTARVQRQENHRVELRTLLPKFKAASSTAADRERALYLLGKLQLTEDSE